MAFQELLEFMLCIGRGLRRIKGYVRLENKKTDMRSRIPVHSKSIE